jgi:hypothetical protein
MEISNDALPWDSEDIDLWRQFLHSQTGTRLIPKLLEAIPPLLEEGDTNKILIRSGLVKGVQLTAQSLLGLAEHPQKPPESPEQYPALENDAVWNDGKKVAEAPTSIE